MQKKYYDWLLSNIKDSTHDIRQYKKLLLQLHSTAFEFHNDMDANRYEDGIDLRYSFVYENRLSETVTKSLNGECSILEMMIALARRCELWMMDTEHDNRVPRWFWLMVSSLGLYSYTDSNYDSSKVSRILNTFVDQEYSSDGKGGLYTVRDSIRPMNTLDIWVQMCCYLNAYYV